MRKLLTISYWAILGLIGLILYSYYLMFWPVKVLEIKQPLKVLTPTVKQGEMLEYVSDYCKYRDVQATVGRAFVDGLVYSMEPTRSNMPVGCHKTVVNLIIPKGLPVGSYKVRINAVYQLNPLRNIEKTWETEFFEVVK